MSIAQLPATRENSSITMDIVTLRVAFFHYLQIFELINERSVVFFPARLQVREELNKQRY